MRGGRFWGLLFLLKIALLFFPLSLLSKEMSLSFEECEKLGKDIAQAQEKMRQFIREKNFELDLGNFTPEEKKAFYEDLKWLIEGRKKFSEGCYLHYGVKVDDLDKLPQDKMAIFYMSKVPFFNVKDHLFPSFFYDYRYLHKLDLKYLISSTKNLDGYCKEIRKFYKKYLTGLEVKENFCTLGFPEFGLSRFSFSCGLDGSSDSLLKLRKFIKITCPKFHIEKEFPIESIKVNVKIPKEEIKVQREEKTSLFSLLFTGKYRYTVQKESIELGDGQALHPLELSGILSGLFATYESALEWLKRELRIRNLY